MTQPAANAIDVDTAHVPCLRCGYDLRGLPADGNCPECGLAVARSAVPSDELRHAPPRWLASLSWGARVVLAVPILGYLYGRLLAPRAVLPSLLAYFGPEAAFSLAFAAGVWLLTGPQRRFAPSGRGVRWALRVVSLVPLAQTVVSYCLWARWFTPPAPLNARPDILMVGLVPLPALLFLHLRRLALRVLSPLLAEHCAIVGVGASLSFALAASGMFVRVPPLVEVTAVAGVILFFLWALVLFARFVIAFGRAHRASAAAWGDS